MWADRRILDLLGIDVPIIQSPMAGANLSDMAIAVSEAGGLGSLPCALLSHEKAEEELAKIRQRTSKPINVNFFCHSMPDFDAKREAAWKQHLRGYYLELGIDPEAPHAPSTRAPFDEVFLSLIETFKPEVVSFHFGLPRRDLLIRVKESGAKVLSSATTVSEACWLEAEGCDAIIAQGFEAGGHRGIFLSQDVSTQVGTMALVPQVADAVKVPVIAAGGIADARGIVAALALGASAVQIGTAYLFTPEATIAPVHRKALMSVKDNETTLTNIFTGRPARSIVNRMVREVGPLSDRAPEFPLAGGALAPLRQKSEPLGSGDFMPLWSGQAARLGRELSAGDLTKRLAEEALARLQPSFSTM